jgi:hypothetical protein
LVQVELAKLAQPFRQAVRTQYFLPSRLLEEVAVVAQMPSLEALVALVVVEPCSFLAVVVLETHQPYLHLKVTTVAQA